MQRVYIVLKNADFTEGRGPMLYDRTFKSESLANEYIMSKKGIFGSKQEYYPKYSSPIRAVYNGYDMILAEVLESLISPEELKDLKKEKAQLEQRIAEIDAKIKE